MRSDTDLTAPARIREAALARFGTDGFTATSVRTIAADAQVSPALILHHFGSKDGLREACDAHVNEFFQSRAGRTAPSRASEFTVSDEALTMLRYLMRQASDDSPRANELISDIIEVTKQSLATQTGGGHIRESADPNMRAALLVMLRLGPLLFSGAMQQATGADVLTAAGLQRMYLTIMEILQSGIYTGQQANGATLELAGYLHSEPPGAGPQPTEGEGVDN